MIYGQLADGLMGELTGRLMVDQLTILDYVGGMIQMAVLSANKKSLKGNIIAEQYQTVIQKD